MVKRRDDEQWADKDVFTTGEAAEICKVSQQTIIRCFDTGRIQGFRVPGSRFRRIPRTELMRFIRRNHIPTDALEQLVKRVLVVHREDAVLARAEEIFARDERVDVRVATTAFDAGILTVQFRPHAIVLAPMPDLDARTVCARVRELNGTMVLLAGFTDVEARAVGARAGLRMPLEPALLAEAVRKVVGLED